MKLFLHAFICKFLGKEEMLFEEKARWGECIGTQNKTTFLSMRYFHISYPADLISAYQYFSSRSVHGVRKRRLGSAKRGQKRKSSPPRPTTGGQSELCHMTTSKKFNFHQIGYFFRNLNSGLRFLVTLVLILALAFATCAAFIVFCRKCDEEVMCHCFNHQP